MTDAARRRIVGVVVGLAMGAVLGSGVFGFVWLAAHGARVVVGVVMATSVVLVVLAPMASPGARLLLDADALQDPVRRLQIVTILMHVSVALFGLGGARFRIGHPLDNVVATALAGCCLAMIRRDLFSAERPTRPPKLLGAIALVGWLAAWPFWMTVQV